MRDLGEGGFMALAMRMRTDANFQIAIGGQFYVGLLIARHDRASPARHHGGAHRALFDEK